MLWKSAAYLQITSRGSWLLMSCKRGGVSSTRDRVRDANACAPHGWCPCPCPCNMYMCMDMYNIDMYPWTSMSMSMHMCMYMSCGQIGHLGVIGWWWWWRWFKHYAIITSNGSVRSASKQARTSSAPSMPPEKSGSSSANLKMMRASVARPA